MSKQTRFRIECDGAFPVDDSPLLAEEEAQSGVQSTKTELTEKKENAE